MAFRRWLALALVLASPLAACGEPPMPPPGLDPDGGGVEVDGGVDVDDVYPGLEDEVRAFQEESGSAGVLLSVSAPGRPRVDIAVGLSEPGVPMRPDMLFKIGSNTKTFTAAAILLLAEEGALDVEDTLADWVPGYFAEDEQITLGQLLTHSSGIFSYTAAEELDRLRDDHRPEELVELAARRPLDFPPGTSVRYSNTGYVLLGMIVERASGRTFEDFVRRRFIEPLELTDTYMSRAEAPRARMAHGYEVYMGTTLDTVDWPTSYAWAAGGMVSSMRDLARWARALYEGEVLSAGSLEAMVTPWVPFSEESGTSYGLGATIVESSFGPAYGHGGGIYGYRSHMEHIPNADVTVIALVTTIGGDVTALADLGYQAALGTTLYE